MEEMGAHYAAAIRTVQRRGPYTLAGFSFGAWMSFEIARHFEAAGEVRSALMGNWAPLWFLAVVSCYTPRAHAPLCCVSRLQDVDLVVMMDAFPIVKHQANVVNTDTLVIIELLQGAKKAKPFLDAHGPCLPRESLVFPVFSRFSYFVFFNPIPKKKIPTCLRVCMCAIRCQAV